MPCTSRPSLPPITISARYALNVMTLAIERSILPRPVVTTAIWPSAHSVRNELDTATPDSELRLKLLVTSDRLTHSRTTPNAAHIQRLRRLQSASAAEVERFIVRSPFE